MQEEQNRGKPNWEHLNEELHVLITVEDTHNRALVKMAKAKEEVQRLLVPAVSSCYVLWACQCAGWLSVGVCVLVCVCVCVCAHVLACMWGMCTCLYIVRKGEERGEVGGGGGKGRGREGEDGRSGEIKAGEREREWRTNVHRFLPVIQLPWVRFNHHVLLMLHWHIPRKVDAL